VNGNWLKRYGASGWHLAALLGCFALTGYTVTRLLGDTSSLLRIVVWFVGAAVVWDLVLGPALVLADRGLRRAVHRVRGVPALNYLRFPAGVSLLLLVVFAPQVLQRSEQRYSAKAGLMQDPYLERWAAVTAALFAASALAYGLAVVRARRTS
jgi:uncharacterized membrane protein YuzA (DUF378 family)